MKLSTRLDPNHNEEDVIRGLPGMGGIQQRLPRLRHDSGKSAAGTDVTILRTPFTIFRSLFQLIFNIEILLRYEYKDSVLDMNAIHKYAEYLMVAIRKDINFYSQADLLEVIEDEEREELLQVNESFQTLLVNIQKAYNDKVSTLPDSISEYDFECIEDDLLLDIPKHPTHDDEEYTDRNQELTLETRYFHLLIFVTCYKIIVHYYSCAQYMLSGYSNIVFSRPANINQINRSLVSLVGLCRPFSKMLNFPEFNVSGYEATLSLFKDNNRQRLPMQLDVTKLAMQLKQTIHQTDLNQFLSILPRCPFYMRIVAETFLPQLCSKWINLYYNALNPKKLDLLEFVKINLPALMTTPPTDNDDISLDIVPSNLIDLLDLIIRDQVLFCPSHLKSIYLDHLNDLQDKQQKESKAMNIITFESTSKTKTRVIHGVESVSWSKIPFYPQQDETKYRRINYINIRLQNVKIDLVRMLLQDFFEIDNKHAFKVIWKSNIKKNDKTEALRKLLLSSKSKNKVLPKKVEKINKSTPVGLAAKSSIKPPASVISDVTDLTETSQALSATTFPNAPNYDPHITPNSRTFSFTPFKAEEPKILINDDLDDIDMADISPTKESNSFFAGIQVKPTKSPPIFELKAPASIPKINIEPQIKIQPPVTLIDLKIPKIEPPIAPQIPFQFGQLQPQQQAQPFNMSNNTYKSFEAPPQTAKIKIDRHKVFAPQRQIPKVLNLTADTISEVYSIPSSMGDNIFAIKPDFDLFIPLKKKRKPPEPIISKKQKMDLELLMQQSMAQLNEDNGMTEEEKDDPMDLEIDELMKECEEILK